MKRQIFTITFLLISCYLIAQEKCGTTEITKYMMDTYPNYKIEKEKVNTETEKWIKENYQQGEKTIITIPVVVHIVWKTSEENISDSRIYEQIEILSNDFRRTNLDAINPSGQVWWGIAADCEIEFCLAQTDPNGNATSGIIRKETSTSQFTMWGGASVKDEADAWPKDDYLNIWVCNLGNTGLLGYADPPSGFMGADNGVVINYLNFGLTSSPQYGKGRTATHEVGHWLNLDHIWGDNNCGDDNVTDTPEQEASNDGCPAFPHNPNSCSTTNPSGDMFMNYMDYTNDACMNLFTQGQKTRMISAINLYRPNMLNHNLCNRGTNISEDISKEKRLIKIIDLLGREVEHSYLNTTLFYIYDDGSVIKKFIMK